MTTVEFSYAIFKLSNPLKTFALKLTRNKDEADDLLQETFSKALFNKEKFLSGTNLKAWLFTIMKNTFITGYQKLMRKRTLLDTTGNLHYFKSTEVADNKAYSDFILQDIYSALNKLDESLREPFILYFNGWKYYEIAEKLLIPIGTVKNRIHVARKQLKENLPGYA